MMPPGTRHFARAPCVQLPCHRTHALLAYASSLCRQTIRIHRFYPMQYTRGRDQQLFHLLPPFEFSEMKFLKNDRGATAVEFALVILPVLLFIFGIMQTAYVLWIDNLLHVSVDTAARCAAVNSTTLPCKGADIPPSVTNMQSTANLVFARVAAP